MFESYSYSGYRLLLRLALWLGVWALVGWLAGHLTLGLLIGSWLLLFSHYRHMNKLAHWLWRERRITPPHGSGSWEPIFNGIYRLQSKNRRRHSQLVRMLSRFREGAEALPDATLVLGQQGEILWGNKLAEHLLGIHWPKDAGNRIQNLLRHPRFVKYWADRRFSEPLELVSPINDQVFLEIRVMAYGDNQRLLIARNVTRLRQLEHMRRDFVANVSHELKTPLTVLQGYVEMMQMSCEPDSVQSRQYQAMEEQSLRMKTLIERLLTLSRIESSSDVDLENPVDLPSMMNALAKEGETLSEGKHQLHFSIDETLKVYGDEMQLYSACANLLQNAVRYSPEGGRIDIIWQRIGDKARFEVRDQGEGIDAEHLPRLTERFYRVDRARSRDTGGSGLGLAIVKHALSHHNSRLEINSVVGQGSRFAFELPANLVVINDEPQRWGS